MEAPSTQLHRQLADVEITSTEDPDILFNRVYNIREQLRRVEDVLSDASLKALFTKRAPSMYAEIGRIHHFKNNYTLEDIRDCMTIIYSAEQAKKASYQSKSSGMTASSSSPLS